MPPRRLHTRSSPAARRSPSARARARAFSVTALISPASPRSQATSARAAATGLSRMSSPVGSASSDAWSSNGSGSGSPRRARTRASTTSAIIGGGRSRPSLRGGTAAAASTAADQRPRSSCPIASSRQQITAAEDRSRPSCTPPLRARRTHRPRPTPGREWPRTRSSGGRRCTTSSSPVSAASAAARSSVTRPSSRLVKTRPRADRAAASVRSSRGRRAAPRCRAHGDPQALAPSCVHRDPAEERRSRVRLAELGPGRKLFENADRLADHTSCLNAVPPGTRGSRRALRSVPTLAPAGRRLRGGSATAWRARLDRLVRLVGQVALARPTLEEPGPFRRLRGLKRSETCRRTHADPALEAERGSALAEGNGRERETPRRRRRLPRRDARAVRGRGRRRSAPGARRGRARCSVIAQPAVSIPRSRAGRARAGTRRAS